MDESAGAGRSIRSFQWVRDAKFEENPVSVAVVATGFRDLSAILVAPAFSSMAEKRPELLRFMVRGCIRSPQHDQLCCLHSPLIPSWSANALIVSEKQSWNDCVVRMVISNSPQ
jgi:hypothetical protein